MEDARFLVHIKTPFLSSAMPYMVSPRDIQKKKILFRLEMKIKKAICRRVKNLIRTSDSDRCETLSTLTSNQITLVPYRYLWLRQFHQSCRHLQEGFVYDEPNAKLCHHGGMNHVRANVLIFKKIQSSIMGSCDGFKWRWMYNGKLFNFSDTPALLLKEGWNGWWARSMA